MKFTFHVPVHDHDEIQVDADDLETASEILYEWVRHNNYLHRVKVVEQNIDDGAARYWHEEIGTDCIIYDEDFNTLSETV